MSKKKTSLAGVGIGEKQIKSNERRELFGYRQMPWRWPGS